MSASQKEINQALYGNRSKYNVDQSAKGKEARTYQGITYHSKHEMEVYRDWVEPQMHMGLIANVKRQVSFMLHAVSPGGHSVKVGDYKADWTAIDRQGKLLILEAKGKPTALYEWKRRHFEAEYGLRIVEL